MSSSCYVDDRESMHQMIPREIKDKLPFQLSSQPNTHMQYKESSCDKRACVCTTMLIFLLHHYISAKIFTLVQPNTKHSSPKHHDGCAP